MQNMQYLLLHLRKIQARESDVVFTFICKLGVLLHMTTTYLNSQSVPRSKHSPPLLQKTGQLMLYREIIAVCSQIHTKHINTLCGQNVELLNVKLAVHTVTVGL